MRPQRTLAAADEDVCLGSSVGDTAVVAVNESRRRDDLYDVVLRPHDERVEAGDWTYYVRGVKREDELLPRVVVWGELLVDVPMLLARGIKRLSSRSALPGLCRWYGSARSSPGKT